MAHAILEVAAGPIDLATGGGLPRRVKLLPIGRVEMRDGRGPYMVRDQAPAAQIVAATRAWLGSADMMFDYDHQSIYAAGEGKGGRAIAAGWAKAANITAEADGIYADVEWTSAAAQKLAAREYRYLSPLFLAAQGTGEVIRLKNAALVNMGAIDLPAIAASSVLMGIKEDGRERRPFTLEELKAAALGTPAQIQSALMPEEQHQCRLLGWTFETYLLEKIRQMEEAGNPGGLVNASQARPIANGLLSAAEIEVCAALGMDHAEMLSERLGVSTAVAASMLADTSPRPPKFSALTAAEIEVCAALGMDQAEFLAFKNEPQR